MSVTDTFLQKTFALTGKVAVVTGASGGIGAHLARTLARAGAAVAVTARREARLKAVAAAVTGDGGDALAVTMDVTDRASVDDGIAQIVKHFGRVDILINNAGVAAPEKFLTMGEDDWRRVLDTDLTAVWRVGQVVAQKMVTQGGGAIINIASMLGIVAQRRQANYAAAKAGVIHLTRVMALELARDGVRVNAVAPGYFATEMNEKFLTSERGKKYLADSLPARAGELRELDGVVLLLAGDAGGYINGAVVSVDGGASLAGV